MSFWGELKRRNVFKVGAAYAIVAWLLVQIASTVFSAFKMPDWTVTFVASLLIMGFPVALILAWAYEMTPEGVKLTKKVPLAESITHITGRKFNYILAGLLTVAVGYIVIDKVFVSRAPVETEITPSVAEQVLPVPEVKEEVKTIAVLPFADLSAEKDQEYFADGIAEELLNSLSRISELEVRGRTSSFYFKGKNEDLHTISNMLNVAHILEGSVRKDGEQVRITVQLIDTRRDAHIWSKTYERTMDDIFAIQDDIAQSVADALQISLGVGELSRKPGMTSNIAAYDAYLSSRQGGDFRLKVEQLQKAVALDPDFAICWHDLAAFYTYMGRDMGGEFLEKAESAYSRVVELLPESDLALYLAAIRTSDKVEEERMYKKALALNPDKYETNFSYGLFLQNVGRPTEAIDYYKRCMRSEPLDSFTYLHLGFAYEFSGNIDAAATAFKKVRELTSGPRIHGIELLALALEENNRVLIDEYVAMLRNDEFSDDTSISETQDFNQVMHALLDSPEEAVAELRLFLNDPIYNDTDNYLDMAVWASYFGDHELALQIFRKNVGSGSTRIGRIWRPIHKGMRQLPGFKNLVKESGLVDYWRISGEWGDFCRPVGDDDFVCD